MKTCSDCGSEILYGSTSHRCNPCRLNRHTAIRSIKYAAYTSVHRAVQRGTLADLKAAVIACADCGGRAVHYDHRDYSEPLAVEPVCPRCNKLRPPAKQVADFLNQSPSWPRRRAAA